MRNGPEMGKGMDKNKAIFTVDLVACWWAGVVKQPKKSNKAKKTNQTHLRQTDRPTDIASYRFA